ncbi:MAG TPA: IS630 family transposase [Chloroflexota bacterium]
MLFVELTEEERAELERVSRQAVGRVALRAHMVLLNDRRYRVPMIAAIHDCGEDVVRLWLHRFEQEGVAGLADEPRSGRPPNDPLAREIVDTQASGSPRASGHVQSCWTVALLAAFLAVRFGLSLSCSTVRRYLHQMGWRWRRPRLTPASVLPSKHDPEEVPKLAAIQQALRAAGRGWGHLLYLDECDLHLLPVLRAMWMKGERVRVPTPGQNRRRAFFGALDAISGTWQSVDHDRKLAVDFVRFLEYLAAIYPTGPLFLVLDSAPTHTAKVVQRWLATNPRLHVLWLPKYAAHEHNPVERLWGLMKEKVAANRLAGSIDELTVAARDFFADLAPHPVSLTNPPALAAVA